MLSSTYPLIVKEKKNMGIVTNWPCCQRTYSIAYIRAKITNYPSFLTQCTETPIIYIINRITTQKIF